MSLYRLIDKYPDVKDIKKLCESHVPNFVWEYFDSATGRERMTPVNRGGFDTISIEPSILHGELEFDMNVRFLGKEFFLPFGIAPVGMSGLIYPDAERVLCSAGERHNIPYCLSNVATMSPERLSKTENVEDVWFQLYAPKDELILRDMLRRIEKLGIKTLVLTVDLPGASVRERQLRAGLTIPPKINLSMICQSMLKPRWGLRRLLAGVPRLEFIEHYSQDTSARSSTEHIGYQIRTSPDEQYLLKLRDLWPHRLVIKGITSPNRIDVLHNAGVDGLWVSNHAGRQFESGISSMQSLISVRAATHLPILFDSGVETGLDIIKAYKNGADFVMMGRNWHYALGAFGASGVDVLVELFKRDLRANMAQMGLSNLRGFR